MNKNQSNGFASNSIDNNQIEANQEKRLSTDEIREILATRVWFLNLPDHVEKAYGKYVFSSTMETYRFNGLFALGIFSILCFCVFQMTPADSAESFAEAYSIALITMLLIRCLAHFRALDRWFNAYVTISRTVMIAAAVYVNNAIPMGTAKSFAYLGLTYILFFVYCSVGIRLKFSMIANLLGGILGFAATYYLGSAVDMEIMLPTFLTGSFLGIFLSYGLRRQERISFLHSYLLDLSLKNSEQISREDALTGLANRRFLMESMRAEWSRMLRYQKPLAIMMIDVDFFKRYNDTLGHIAGDQCLRDLAQLIQKEAHRSGELVARYGGEEFAILLPNIDVDHAVIQAQRILARVATAAIPHPHTEEGFLRLSIGIAVCIPDHSTTVDMLLNQADNALYAAKANGRNRYVVFGSHDDKM